MTAVTTQAPARHPRRPLDDLSRPIPGRVILVTGAAGGLGSGSGPAHTRRRLGRLHRRRRRRGRDGPRNRGSERHQRADWDETLPSVRNPWPARWRTLRARHPRPGNHGHRHALRGMGEDHEREPGRLLARPRSILPLTEQAYGRVAILSSISAREGNPHQAAYSASKRPWCPWSKRQPRKSPHMASPSTPSHLR